MKINKLKTRLSPNRTMIAITMRMPEDVIADLKRVAPHRGFSGYQPLIRAYIGQGLRADLDRLEGKPDVAALVKVLRKRGVNAKILSSAVEESKLARGSHA